MLRTKPYVLMRKAGGKGIPSAPVEVALDFALFAASMFHSLADPQAEHWAAAIQAAKAAERTRRS